MKNFFSSVIAVLLGKGRSLCYEGSRCCAIMAAGSVAEVNSPEIPCKDKDDIAWRDQLSGEYFTEGEEVTGRFGDVFVIFALE